MDKKSKTERDEMDASHKKHCSTATGSSRRTSNFCRKFARNTSAADDGFDYGLNELLRLGRALNARDELIGPYGKRLSGPNHSEVWGN